MRILQVITRGDEAGGAQSHLRELATALAADGHDVHVVAGSIGILTDQLAASGIPVHHCPSVVRPIDPLRDARAVADLRGLIRRVQPDVVATHSSKAGMVGRSAATLAGKPSVFTAHGWAFNQGLGRARHLYRLLERGCAPMSRRIICVSEYDRRIAVEAGFAAERLVTVPNGLPDDDVLPAAAGRSGPMRALMVARFAAPKDHATLLRAVALVPGMTLDLIGDGPDLPAAQALAAELHLGDRVRFLGRRNDVPLHLAAADLFVLSSRSEGFPISTLEAMRAARPVVVSRVGGAPEAVVDGQTGLVVPPADPVAMAAALETLASDPERRLTMGLAARRHFLDHYTLPQMVAATLATYEQALSRSRFPRSADRRRHSGPLSQSRRAAR